MTAVKRHHFKLFVKSKSNFAIVLLAQICPIRLFIILAFHFFILNLSFFARLKIYLRYSTKLRSQKIAKPNKMVLTIQTILLFNSSYCYALFVFTA